MISLELSSIQAKSSEREAIASACERFISAGGKIVAVPGIEARYDSPHAWNRNDMALPGSSQTTRDHNADAALAARIKEIVAKGGGISSMRVTLQVDPSRIKRVAKAYGIEIPTVRASTTISERARQAISDSRAAGRTPKIQVVATLAAGGSTIAVMAAAVSVNRQTIMRWLKQYDIQRGPKMDLSA
jgi:hypothetical protein